MDGTATGNMKAICVLLRLLVSVPLGNRGRDYSLAPQAIRTLGTRGGVINCFLFLFRISRSRSALVCLFFFFHSVASFVAFLISQQGEDTVTISLSPSLSHLLHCFFLRCLCLSPVPLSAIIFFIRL